MNEIDAFLAAIRADIDDDTARLVFADWLQEHGHDAQAEFIRFDCHYSGFAPGSWERRQLRERRRAMLEGHIRTWNRALRPHIANCKVIRGFVEIVRMSEEQCLESLGEVIRNTALRRVVISSRIGVLDWERFLANPALPELREFFLDRGLSDQTLFDRFCAAPMLRNLEGISLASSDITRERLERLLSGEALQSPIRLALWLNRLDDEAIEFLADSPRVRRLRFLNLGGNEQLTDRAISALAQSPNLRKLETLLLWRSKITNDGLKELVASPNLDNLHELNLLSTSVSDKGVEHLASSPHLSNLEVLYLTRDGSGTSDSSRLSDKTLKLIARSPHMQNLQRLQFDGNRFTDRGLRHLIDSPYLQNVTAINLSQNTNRFSVKARKAMRKRFPHALLIGLGRPHG